MSYFLDEIPTVSYKFKIDNNHIPEAGVDKEKTLGFFQKNVGMPPTLYANGRTFAHGKRKFIGD